MAQEKKFFHGKCRNRFQADDFCAEQKYQLFLFWEKIRMYILHEIGPERVSASRSDAGEALC